MAAHGGRRPGPVRLRALGGLEERRGVRKADRERAEGLGTLALFLPMMRALQPALDRFAASLEAVQTRDPALRSGRSAWRQQAVSSGKVYGPLPEDVCGQLRAWERGGARGVPLPGVDLDLGGGTIADGVLTAEESTSDDEDEGEDILDTDGKAQRAAERLRELGQGPRRAARFSGDAAPPAVRRRGDGPLRRPARGDARRRVRRLTQPRPVTPVGHPGTLGW